MVKAHLQMNQHKSKYSLRHNTLETIIEYVEQPMDSINVSTYINHDMTVHLLLDGIFIKTKQMHDITCQTAVSNMVVNERLVNHVTTTDALTLYNRIVLEQSKSRASARILTANKIHQDIISDLRKIKHILTSLNIKPHNVEHLFADIPLNLSDVANYQTRMIRHFLIAEHYETIAFKHLLGNIDENMYNMITNDHITSPDYAQPPSEPFDQLDMVLDNVSYDTDSPQTDIWDEFLI